MQNYYEVETDGTVTGHGVHEPEPEPQTELEWARQVIEKNQRVAEELLADE